MQRDTCSAWPPANREPASITRSPSRGCGGFFAATRCADEGFAKPHPDMLLRLMDRVGVSPGDTLMIGDTTHDLELARNAGVAALAVAYGAHPPEDLMQQGPLATLHSIPELRAWLAGNA